MPDAALIATLLALGGGEPGAMNLEDAIMADSGIADAVPGALEIAEGSALR